MLHWSITKLFWGWSNPRGIKLAHANFKQSGFGLKLSQIYSHPSLTLWQRAPNPSLTHAYPYYKTQSRKMVF